MYLKNSVYYKKNDTIFRLRFDINKNILNSCVKKKYFKFYNDKTKKTIVVSKEDILKRRVEILYKKVVTINMI